MKKTVLPLLLLLLAAPQQACVKAGGEEAQPSFVISPDPAVAVISVLTSGGSSRYQRETALYGDGRLVTTVRQQEALRSSQEVELSFQEMEELVRIVIEGGLMEWTWEDYNRKIRDSLGGHRPASSSDSPMQRFTIRLEEYRAAAGAAAGPVEVHVDTVPPRFLKSVNPGLEVEEVDALIALSSAIDRHMERAAGGGE